MKQTVNEYDFCHAFVLADRKYSFSYAARKALFAYLEEYEKETGTEIELDVIGICCDFAEYASALDAGNEYGFEPDEEADEESQEAAALDWLRGRTKVIEFDGGIVVQSF